MMWFNGASLLKTLFSVLSVVFMLKTQSGGLVELNSRQLSDFSGIKNTISLEMM